MTLNPPQHAPHESNLTPGQCQALAKLQKNAELIIKQADKGGNIVLMTPLKYETKCNRILDNQAWYRKISLTNILTFHTQFRQILCNAYTNALIDRDTFESLDIKHPRDPIFHAIPKIH